MRVSDREVRTSRENKVFFGDDGFTKGDVIGYYRAVADVMTPHLRGRPLALRRYPDGLYGEGFFQKEVADYFPDWLDTAQIPLREGTNQRSVVGPGPASLVYLADQASLEFHIWPSRIQALDRPDRLVVDIDPPGGCELAEVRDVARRVRDLFVELGLVPFVQTTGGKGFHVVAPLDATAGQDLVLRLAHDAANSLVRADPDRLTTAHRKERRGRRIFLDTNRNGYAQTFIAPYSLRARPGAPVAVPLNWHELGKAEPNGWNIVQVRRRLAHKEDPWAGMDGHAVAADKASARLSARVDQREAR